MVEAKKKLVDVRSLMVDLSKESDGVWVEYNGVELLIASSGKQDFLDAREAILEEHIEAIRNDELTADKLTDLAMPAVAEHILLDWKNLSEDGKEVEYSPEQALEYLTDPALKDMRNFILQVSSQRARFRQLVVEDGVKN